MLRSLLFITTLLAAALAWAQVEEVEVAASAVHIRSIPWRTTAQCLSDFKCKSTGRLRPGEKVRVITVHEQVIEGRREKFLEIQKGDIRGFISPAETDFEQRYRVIEQRERISQTFAPDASRTTAHRDASRAQDETEAEVVDPNCPDCHQPDGYFAAIRKKFMLFIALDAVTLRNPIPPFRLGSDFEKQCSNLISRDGELGPWGKALLKEIDTVDRTYRLQNNGRSCFYNDIDVKAICPGFTKFSTMKKQQFWAYAISSIARVESECNSSARTQGVNGVADGLLQLEGTLQHRSWRDSRFCATNGPTNTQNLHFQFQCGASIIVDSHCRGTRRPLNSGESYWQKLRYDREILQRIAIFPNCKAGRK